MSLLCPTWSPAAALFYFGSCYPSGKNHDPDFGGSNEEFHLSVEERIAKWLMTFARGILEDHILLSKTDLQGFFWPA